jgi:cytochrome c biogenesis protein CcdA
LARVRGVVSRGMLAMLKHFANPLAVLSNCVNPFAPADTIVSIYHAQSDNKNTQTFQLFACLTKELVFIER